MVRCCDLRLHAFRLRTTQCARSPLWTPAAGSTEGFLDTARLGRQTFAAKRNLSALNRSLFDSFLRFIRMGQRRIGLYFSGLRRPCVLKSWGRVVSRAGCWVGHCRRGRAAVASANPAASVFYKERPMGRAMTVLAAVGVLAALFFAYRYGVF